MILRWWRTQGIRRYDSLECLELTAAVGANFVVTNCSAVNHFFDCHAAWCACWPFYLLLAVPYKIWRNAFQGIRDIPVTMEGNAISTSMSFSNYSLRDLHLGLVYYNQPSWKVERLNLSIAADDWRNGILPSTIQDNRSFLASINQMRTHRAVHAKSNPNPGWVLSIHLPFRDLFSEWAPLQQYISLTVVMLKTTQEYKSRWSHMTLVVRKFDWWNPKRRIVFCV